MAETPEFEVLTNAYLRAHPADAARELERLPAEEAAELLMRVPVRLAAPVFGAMLPYLAARTLRRTAPERAAGLLASISVPAASAVLRYLPEHERVPLLDALPAAIAIACRALLGYAEDSVGAAVDSEIVALPPTAKAADALAALQATRVNPSAPVYVVDANRRPLGSVPLTQLLRAGGESPLSDLMSRVDATLPALASMSAADQHPLWSSNEVAPVVERGGALIGVLERRKLYEQRRRSDANTPAAESLPGMLTLGYWDTVAGLIEALVFDVPREGR